MIYSQSAISDLLYYDVVCVGNYAAIVADHINCYRQYKTAALHFHKEVNVPLTSFIGPELVSVNCKPKNTDIIRKKIQQILPKQNTIVLDDGHRIVYKYLVHGEDGWTVRSKTHPLFEALENKYSRVFCNIHKENKYKIGQGNIVFYVPKGAGNFRQNYSFLKLADQLEGTKAQIRILVEGESFYPYCSKANNLLLNQLETKHISINYNVKITKIDYLRRLLSYNSCEELIQLPYQSVYCLIDELSPSIFNDSGIDPKDCHPKLLHNNKFSNIYVIGADIFPTTFSFFALGMQIHYIVKNITERLLASENHKKAMLSSYDGSTSFYIYLGQKTIAKVSHKYDGKEFNMESIGQCWSSLHPYVQKFLTKQYLNFDNFGPPHYLWSPSLVGTQKWRDQSDSLGEKEQLLKLSQINYKTNLV